MDRDLCYGVIAPIIVENLKIINLKVMVATQMLIVRFIMAM